MAQKGRKPERSPTDLAGHQWLLSSVLQDSLGDFMHPNFSYLQHVLLAFSIVIV